MNIFCIGRNYAKHAKELNNVTEEDPIVFMKPQTALSTLQYTSFSKELNYECELVISICDKGKNISLKDADKFWDKITIGIDYTARDLQYKLKSKGLPWEKSKAFDGSAFLGKWVERKNLINPFNIEFEFFKNEQKVQHGFSKDMIFDFAHIIADISIYFTLNKGDIIFTGTPEGVGTIVQGDVLSATLEGIKNFTTRI